MDSHYKHSYNSSAYFAVKNKTRVEVISVTAGPYASFWSLSPTYPRKPPSRWMIGPLLYNRARTYEARRCARAYLYTQIMFERRSRRRFIWREDQWRCFLAPPTPPLWWYVCERGPFSFPAWIPNVVRYGNENEEEVAIWSWRKEDNTYVKENVWIQNKNTKY